MSREASRDAGPFPRIGPVSADLRAEALALVFSRLAGEEHRQQIETTLRKLTAGEASPAGLLGADRDGELVGAMFSQIQPGKTALLWPPQLATDEPTLTAVELLRAMSDWLTQQQVRVAQVLLPQGGLSDEAVLLADGFKPLAGLLYLVSQEAEFPDSLPRSQLQFESYSAENHQRLAQIVEATYQDTLDCPQLDGVREIEDILTGYRATGVFDPQRWLIVLHAGEDIGCLLLTDHPSAENCELVYMGLIPASRGHGWGMDVARHAQWLARRAGRPRLVLAVDAGNEPAIRTYAAVGFQLWDRRKAYLKILQQ
jgi:mycothiol synthase